MHVNVMLRRSIQLKQEFKGFLNYSNVAVAFCKVYFKAVCHVYHTSISESRVGAVWLPWQLGCSGSSDPAHPAN